jgi:mercuric ion transport protein
MTEMTSLPPPARDPTTTNTVSRPGLVASVGAIGTAVLASLCCIGPLIFVVLGVGAGLASRFEPLRPLFTVLTVALLAAGFYVVYGRTPVASEGAACAPDGRCPAPPHRTRDRVVLWVATVIALLVLTFPWWSLLFV